jgi:creatinine amidohydrolase/Fe(II)-dependent formamide hydrolase-like protein
MNLENEINEFMLNPAHRERLMNAAMDTMQEQIKQQFQWKLPDIISAECNEFLKEHVAPEIRNHLIKNKGMIVNAAKKAADEIGNKIAESMIERATKKLENAYSASQIVKSVFD